MIDIREQIAELPSYGYRRACALVNRAGRLSDRPRVNPKRVYRVMASHGSAAAARAAATPIEPASRGHGGGAGQRSALVL